MAELRIGRGFSSAEVRERLERLESAPSTAPEGWPARGGWRAERRQSVIAAEEPGPPRQDGAFARAKEALFHYEHSDPSIVVAHFFEGELLGRRMLLDIQVLGLHYLSGVVVSELREDEDARRSTFGFRYDTLEGHIERGSEWFLVEKDHHSGEVRFTIASTWRPGDLPNRWSRVGFAVLAPYYRRVWLRRAHERLRALLRQPMTSLRRPSHVFVREGPPTASLPVTHQDAQPHAPAHALFACLGLGTLAGMRSLSAPTLLAFRGVITGPRPGASLVERALSAPGAVVTLTAAAAGEVLADKHPRMPARVGLLPLIGRVGVGAVSGYVVARRWRTPVASAVAAGACAAGASTWLSYAARERLTRGATRSGSRRSPWLLGLLEDGVVLAGAFALSRAMDRIAPLPLVPAVGEDQT